MPRADSGRRGPPPASLEDASRKAREWIALAPEQSAARMKDASSDVPASGDAAVELLVALRTEASGQYHSDAAEARRIARLALGLAEKIDMPLASGWAHRTLAEALLFSGRMRDAEVAYANATKAWRDARADALLGQLLVGRIHVLTLLGRRDEAARMAREAEELLARAGDQTYLAKLAMNLGNTHFQRDEYGAALDQYERAARVFSRLGVRDQTAIGLEVNRAVVLTQLDRDEEALALFGRLEAECTRLGLDLLRAQVLMNTAYVHALRGDFGRALGDLAQATDYFSRTDHPAFLGNCLINHAEIYQQLNLFPDALPLATEAVGLFDREGLRYDKALALAQVAWIHLGRGAPEDLLGAVRDARRLFALEHNPARVALMKLIHAEALLRQGSKAGLVVRQAREALRVFQKLGLVRWEAACANLIARSSAAPAAPERIRWLHGILARLPDRVYPLQVYGVLEQLGRAHEEVGAPREASRQYARAVERLEGMRLRAPTEDSKIGLLADRTHLYDRLLRLELARRRPRPERLFEWMERSRAQSLWDRMRHPGVPGLQAGSPAAGLRRRLSWLHARVSRLELGTAEERRRADRLRPELIRVEKTWVRNRRAWEEAHSSAADTGKPSGKAPSLAEIAAALPNDYGFLSYHLGVDFSLALAVTRGGVLWRPLDADLRPRLEELLRRLDFQWSAAAMATARSQNPHRLLRSATDAILRDMYDLLWRPLEERGLPECNWIVSPHGGVHRVPLAALLTEDQYLVQRSRLLVTPSARVWLDLRRRRPSKRAFVAGVPGPRLAAIEREIELVHARLERWDVKVARAPTRVELQRESAHVGLLHLAAHGSLRGDNPAFSFIELSDGPLFVHDLAEFRLPGTMVVLTACSSGRGVAPAGDEWIGLAQGFLSAGAGSVVASLWPVQDSATRDLMDRFYAHFAAGRDPAGALGNAMRDLMKTHPHPWQWASFAAFGGGPGRKGGGIPALQRAGGAALKARRAKAPGTIGKRRSSAPVDRRVC